MTFCHMFVSLLSVQLKYSVIDHVRFVLSIKQRLEGPLDPFLHHLTRFFPKVWRSWRKAFCALIVTSG